MIKTLLITFLILISLNQRASAVVCACFYLEYPQDEGFTIMSDYSQLMLTVSTLSLTVIPFALIAEGAFYEVEKSHRSSVKNTNMGVIENRESMKMMTKSVGQRTIRKSIACQTNDIDLTLAQSKILYLEELLLEVEIDSNKRIAKEKNRLLGR